MQEFDDSALLREYVERDSEEAFAALVTRHVNKVYSVALRHTGDPHSAEEITQAVFVILAKKSRHLSKRVILSGWLYQTARLTAVTFIRSQIRRVRREQEAYMQTVLNENESDAWMQIAPLLDAAMAGLNETDRHAVVLRFFDGKSLREVGAALGANEDAAKKRVSRALEKLHRYFSKRGVSLTTVIIAGAISANSVQAAPETLAKTVTANAVAKGAAAGGSTSTLIKGALKIMAWQKAKMAMAVGGAMILAASTTALVVQHEPQPSRGIPYKMADDIWQLINRVNTNKLDVHMAITSTNKAVYPADIRITIQSFVKGPISVRLGTNGQVVDFPHDEALRRENPTVTVNQPEGTTTLTVFGYIPIPEDLTFRYGRLVDGVAETSTIIGRATRELIRPSYIGWGNYMDWLSSPALKVNGVLFGFPKASARKATVEIMTAKGVKTYRADSGGQIKLKLDKSMTLENPEVKVSEKPLFIGPDLQ